MNTPTQKKKHRSHITRKSSGNDAAKAPLAAPKKRERILVIAHNHPNFFPGGAEILAYDLFNSLKNHENVDPFFMAGVTAHDRRVHTGTPFQMISSNNDEILFWGADFDYFLQSQNIKSFMYLDFKLFLEKHQPDVIHFHHTMRVGLEALQIARQTLPNVRILYTLHEFILMCHRDGQMVRTKNNELCDRSSPARCNQCFPDISPAEFKMRESFIKAHLEHVDMFISPSEFLAKRFVAWGIPAEKMLVMENGRDIAPAAPFRTLPKGGKRNVFGYFGQINPYKGGLLTLKACENLLRQGFDDFRMEFFGNIEMQSDEFKKEFFDTIDKYNENIGFHGKYKQSEIPTLLGMVDWVIVPSTWWENSPLVIQEVFMHKRPIIASDIGGMAEKVEDGVTGLHFKVRSELSLAKTIHKAATDNALWQKLVDNIGPRLSIEDCTAQHVALYEKLKQEKTLKA